MKDLVLPEELRNLLKKPFGEVLTGTGKEPAMEAKRRIGNGKVIVVGDVTLRNMQEVGIVPDLAVVDLKTKRTEEMPRVDENAVKVKNPPGMITSELWEKIGENMGKGNTIVIDGEEDLAVIPCVLDADWNSFVVYGQPDVGMVLVEVTEEAKEKAGMIVKLMQERTKVKAEEG